MAQNADNSIYYHKPVMLEEVVRSLQPCPGKVYVDATAGGGGHSEEILKLSSPGGRLVAVDQDPDALREVSRRLGRYEDRLRLEKANFAELPVVLERLGINSVDGVLLDLGVSSYQLDNPRRGFSYMEDAPLDMRMDPEQEETAASLVNSAPYRELAGIIKKYGEEKWASRIAEFIVKERQRNRIETTGQLVEVIKKAIPAGARRKGPHPAKRTFQGLRIALNRELENLESGLRGAVKALSKGGRVCVISFHSLEDRVVKNVFRELADPCTCPRDFPQCVCGRQPELRILTRSPLTPGPEEMENNPRARSARLRAAEKL